MSYPAPPTPSIQSTESIGQGAIVRGDESQRRSPRTVLIHILDDDSLLNIFSLYRPAFFDDDEDDDDRILGGMGWDRERWWYKLTHVCQRWRNIILGSASHLHISLFCTWGTPVADMLAHSPPLPLVVDYADKDRDITAEDEERIFLALEQHHRVRRVRLGVPILNMQKLIMAMDEEYPVLEHLIMVPSTEEDSTALTLPGTLQAPHLRHLLLEGFALPMGSRLLTTAVGLVTLVLIVSHSFAYIQPSTVLQWLSSMSQLETVAISFLFPIPNRDVERQLMHTPVTTHVTLPNLRWFEFRGASTYLEAVAHRITTPRLEKLFIQFFKQLTFSVPSLLQFINTTENLRFDSAEFEFSEDKVYADFYPREDKMAPLQMNVRCWHLDWQVSSVAQILDSISQLFSPVEHLTFEHKVHSRSTEEHNEVDRTEWRKLLGSFSNAKTLRVDEGLVKELSCSLRPDDGELPLELLPELQELTYSGDDNTGDAFTPFIDARQNAGRPVTLIRSSPRSVTPLSHSPSPGVLELSDISIGSVEAGIDHDLDS